MNVSSAGVGSSAAMSAPVCTGVVGVGYFGALHAQCYANLPSSRLAALVDPEPATQALANKFGVPWYRSIDALPSSVTAVSIATPVETHYALTRTLLERGIDVLLEKPIAETMEQAAHLRALAQSHRRILQIGHIERFNPAFSAAAGVLRAAHCIRAYRTSERQPRSIAMDVVVDLMIHDLDLILSQCAAHVVELHAHGRGHGYTDIDEAHAQLVLSNGCRIELHASWGVASRGATGRHMVVELADGVWTLDFRQRQTWRCASDGSTDIENVVGVAPQDELTAQLSAFLDATRTRSAPRVTGEDGHAALALAHRIRRQILDPAS
jgi:predicted dehydrogenase